MRSENIRFFKPLFALAFIAQKHVLCFSVEATAPTCEATTSRSGVWSRLLVLGLRRAIIAQPCRGMVYSCYTMPCLFVKRQVVRTPTFAQCTPKNRTGFVKNANPAIVMFIYEYYVFMG